MFDELIIIINILILTFVIKRFNINIYASFFISFFIIYILFINVNPRYNDFNKCKALSYIPYEYKPHTFLYNKKDVDLTSLKYPIIFKPNVCSGLSTNVKIIHNIKEAKEYIEKHNENEILIQEFIDYTELGVLYEKDLFTYKGKIISIVRKQSNKTKIMHGCEGEISCDNLNYIINDDLNKLFDKISNNIPDFYVGRYDIKCKDIQSFIDGKFYILEVNGTMGFDLDKRLDVYNLNYFNIPSAIIKVQRWFLSRCLMGFVNIVSGRSYNNIYEMLNEMFMIFYNNTKCKNWEKIVPIKTL